jgi:hypothetical protein
MLVSFIGAVSSAAFKPDRPHLHNEALHDYDHEHGRHRLVACCTCDLSLETQQPPPPRLPRPCQFGPLSLQLRLKPRQINVQLCVFVRQGFQFIEHDGYVARHADLIGLGVVRLGARVLCFFARLLDPLDLGGEQPFQHLDACICRLVAGPGPGAGYRANSRPWAGGSDGGCTAALKAVAHPRATRTP